jgi:serine/threonine protein kinase
MIVLQRKQALYVFQFLFFIFLLPLFSNENTNFIITSPKGNAYELITSIGEGCKGTVYLAKDSEGSSYAVKELQSKAEMQALSFPEEYIEAVFSSDGVSLIGLSEYQKAQQLDHPNILKIEEYFPFLDRGGILRTYLIMEYINGITLDKFPKATLKRSQAIENAMKLVAALKYALNNGLIHNDLYSSNIMIDDKGEIKLIDLDSFDELQSQCDETSSESNQGYLYGLTYEIRTVLSCAEFEDIELYEIQNQMNDLLLAPCYDEYLNHCICTETVDCLNQFFDELSSLLISWITESQKN